MTLKQFANVDSLYRDLTTGEEVPWREYMHRVIEKLGAENIKPYIPYDMGTIKEKLKSDIHLNNTRLQEWYEAGGFWFYKGELTYKAIGLSRLFVQNKITCFSPSDCVCVLKETARILCNN